MHGWVGLLTPGGWWGRIQRWISISSKTLAQPLTSPAYKFTPLWAYASQLGCRGLVTVCRSIWTPFPRGHLPRKWCKQRETLVFRWVLALPFFALIHRNDANLSWNRPARLQPVFITFCTFPVRYKFLIRIGLQGFLYNSKYCNRLSQTPNVLKKILLPIFFFFFFLQDTVRL